MAINHVNSFFFACNLFLKRTPHYYFGADCFQTRHPYSDALIAFRRQRLL